MTGNNNNTIGAAAVLFALVASIALAAHPASGQATGNPPDPFTRCVEQGAGETACLARLGEQFDWRPTEAACRFLEAKTEAIIEAGGDVRYRDLFYNERCVRLGFPYGETAAKAGVKVTPDSPFEQCRRKENTLLTDCSEELGQHAQTEWESVCYFSRNELREDRTTNELSSWLYLFDNERCWRLGLPHHEKG